MAVVVVTGKCFLTLLSSFLTLSISSSPRRITILHAAVPPASVAPLPLPETLQAVFALFTSPRSCTLRAFVPPWHTVRVALGCFSTMRAHPF